MGAEDSQLKEKVRILAEELEQLKQRRAESTPWWAMCLRGSPGASLGNAATAGAGAALMRALGSEPNTPRALTPRGHQAMSQTPRSRSAERRPSADRRPSAGRRPSTGSASGPPASGAARRGHEPLPSHRSKIV